MEKKRHGTRSGPPVRVSFLGPSWLIGLLAIRLVQWLGWVLEKKERKEDRNGIRHGRKEARFSRIIVQNQQIKKATVQSTGVFAICMHWHMYVCTES